MNNNLQTLLESYIQNRDILKKAGVFITDYLYPVCAYMLCAENKTADREKLDACKALLKEKAGIFSIFRGSITMPLLTLLSMEENPEQKMEEILTRYNALKKSAHFLVSEPVALAALLLPDGVDVEQVGIRAKELHRRMNKNHPFLTTSEQPVYAVLMAASGREEESLIADVEECYAILKDYFGASAHALDCACILALDEKKPLEKTSRVPELFDALRQSGIKYGKGYELPVLAALSLTMADNRLLCSDLIDADGFLSQQKGYGFFGMGKKMRLMHAAMLLYHIHGSGDSRMKEAALSTMFALIAAMRNAANT